MSFINKSAVLIPMLSSKIFQCTGFLNYAVTRRYSDQKHHSYDIVVIGGGIVGSASARELILRHPTLKIAVVEKENRFACHQSGNNSGVIHAGIYYKPGSLKAKLCVEGLNLSYQYLDKKGIKYSKCGKLIVATQRSEVPRLLDLYDRGVKNGVKDIKLMDSKEMRELEPNCRGLEALWSPHTGIVDWGVVTNSYVKDFEECGGKSYLNFEVTKFIESEGAEHPVIINSSKGDKIEAKYVLTCCGLQSDKVAVLTGCPEEPKIIPFRGEYLYLKPSKSKIANANIYPVPDPRFPFLGVHLTPKIDGRVIVGPNAILAFCKEGYRWGDVNMKEFREIIRFSGFQRMALKYASFGLKEMTRSLIMPLQVMQIQKYIQNITSADVERGPAGVRAQAMAKDGTLIEDFVFDSQPGSGAIGSRVLHCRNAPSPGATSSLAIAKMIADKMEEEFKL
ncbi:PREDICTED: L-2-hydroxyglutarate dehydrogenase, mitochondrial [Papilio polytes]|uniref:L-2-hydroxyglutarate dehydrogenase, mitochondrial n=1 Tax=Papilio polytes TaxID=76194 RepID=UPI000675EB0E|nr:PREDICTED: L-2-hydroxyglutarate dehydrogenase, mitochondrial [Papilio polytes]